MVKQSRKKLRRSKRKSHKRSNKKMFGGDFSQEENQQLLGMGFSQDDIKVLAGTGVGLNIIQMSLNQINPATGNPFTPQELIQSVNDANNEIENLDEDLAVPNQENDVPGAPGAPYNDVPIIPGANHNEEQGPGLNMEDLGPYSPRSVTEVEGGKRRKTRKTRKGKKGRKSRKQRGGMCFGNGVGANNYDPNFSIYNTRELTLFPYRPTN
jgi:hypothetical protein